MSDHIALLEETHAARARGDFETGTRLLAENVRWHVPNRGVELEGREKVVQFTKEMYRRGFRYSTLHSAEYGDVVVSWVAGTLEGQPFKACYGQRFQDDKLIEFTSVRT